MTGANAMGVPGCPDFACWTASIDKVRMVLMQSSSIEGSPGAAAGFRLELCVKAAIAFLRIRVTLAPDTINNSKSKAAADVG